MASTHRRLVYALVPELGSRRDGTGRVRWRSFAPAGPSIAPAKVSLKRNPAEITPQAVLGEGSASAAAGLGNPGDRRS